DDSGHKSITMHYSAADQPIGKDLYIYDSEGNEIEEHRYKFDGESWTLWQRTVSTYDERDLMISKLTYNGEGALESRWLYVYDGNRNLGADYLYSGSQILKEHHVYTYELDSIGNWIKRMTYEVTLDNGLLVPETVTYREIEYYKGWSDLIDNIKTNTPQ